MIAVKEHEPNLRIFTRKPTCPIGKAVTDNIGRAIYQAVTAIMRDKPFVGAFAVDWQDAQGRVAARIARFDLENGYEANNPDGDLRQIVGDSLDVAAADWMNNVLGWTGRTNMLLYAVPDFLHREGTHIPMGAHGILVLTFLATTDHVINREVVQSVEQEFHALWKSL